MTQFFVKLRMVGGADTQKIKPAELTVTPYTIIINFFVFTTNLNFTSVRF